ncbi:MAG: protein-L-isoaspartate O-methyltransferase [Hyphomicrobiales bacterium]|nr:protein-L-isoaspartate O-methyltransferase [Hyphomicrobiales bacterium]
MTDPTIQRLNMLDSQIRPSDITDRRILRAMGEVARELFVPVPKRPVAYVDGPIEVVAGSKGEGARALLPPRTLAKMIQLCGLGDKAVVLDVGCATGYSTAVLARIARRVVAVEANADLAAGASKVLTELKCENASVHAGPLVDGRQGEGPYDAILMNGAIEIEPRTLLDQLKDGGRLVAVSAGRAGKAVVWTRAGRDYDRREDFDATAPLLPGFAAARAFTF